ncbi:MAG: hypothetical protein R2710_12670 [Acidimicrobiales bacterium]
MRAIERKNLPAALALAEAIGATAGWLTGPAEEDYAPTLARSARHGPHPSDPRTGRRPALYAAADLVVFPSTWERLRQSAGRGGDPSSAGPRRLVSGRGRTASDGIRVARSGVDPDVVEVARREIVSPTLTTRPQSGGGDRTTGHRGGDEQVALRAGAGRLATMNQPIDPVRVQRAEVADLVSKGIRRGCPSTCSPAWCSSRRS